MEINDSGLNPYCIGRCSLSIIWPMAPSERISLNPYCIGRCSLREQKKQMNERLKVLILIVLEDAL